jgi:outer membrane protein TolC
LQLGAQVRVAKASLKQAEASLFPSLNLNMSASRAANQLSVPKGTSYSLSAPMSWELDVWGRIDALTQVSASNAAATAWDLRQAQVSVQALLVQTYVTLLAAQGQEALLAQTVQVYEKSLKLTQARYRAGVVSSADVAQASTQLKSTQAQWQDLILQRKQIEHALATLLGMVPAQLTLERVDTSALVAENTPSPGLASATVTAVEFSQVWRIDRGSLEEFMNVSPLPAAHLLIGISSTLSRRLRDTNEKVATMGQILNAGLS